MYLLTDLADTDGKAYYVPGSEQNPGMAEGWKQVQCCPRTFYNLVEMTSG